MRGILLCDNLLSPCGFEQYIYFLNDIVTKPMYVVGHHYLLYMERQYFLFVVGRQFQPRKKVGPSHAYKYLKVVVISKLEVHRSNQDGYKKLCATSTQYILTYELHVKDRVGPI